MRIPRSRQNSRKPPKLVWSAASDPCNVLPSPILPRHHTNSISRPQLSLSRCRVTSVNLADITCDTTSRLRLMTAGDTFSCLCQQRGFLIGRQHVSRLLIGREHGGELIGRLHYWCRHLAYLQLLVQLSPDIFATCVTSEAAG